MCVVQELELISQLNTHTSVHKVHTNSFMYGNAAHTNTHVINPHGFDDAKQREPQGAACLNKTKQMFMCTMSP